MKFRRLEIIVAVILTIICYLGDSYLKEDLNRGGIAPHTLTWQVLNILWLFLMVALGYWGLKDHEYKWLKIVWLTVNSILLIVLFINKLVQYFWHSSFIPEATSTVIRTPFFFIMAVFLPRWFSVYKKQ